jgi:hypothetical protein
MHKQEMFDVLSEFARTMVTDVPIQRILDPAAREDRRHHALCSPGIAEADGRKVEVEQQPGSGCGMSLNLVI